MAILIGVLIGLVLGLTGAGGSVLAVPLLMAGLGLSLPESAGLSLGAVGAAATIGVLLRLGKGQISWMPALFLALGGAVFTPVGRYLSGMMPERLSLSLFMALVLAIAIRMWRQANRHPDETEALRASVNAGAEGRAQPICRLSPSGQFEMRLPCVLRLALAGALTGVLSGLFGVGGGFVIVPALVLLTGLPMMYAVATSLAVIAGISTTGFVAFLHGGMLSSAVLLPVTLGGLGGMLLGTVIAPRLAGPHLQKLFVLLMVPLAAYTLLHAVL